MTTIKTIENDASVENFIASIEDPLKQQDCRTLVALFARASKQVPRMWGTSIVGLGQYHYQYANGKPGVICKVGFAPRAKSFAFYLANIPERASLLANMGKHKFSGGCIHLSKLDGVNLLVLEKVVQKAYVFEDATDNCSK